MSTNIDSTLQTAPVEYAKAIGIVSTQCAWTEAMKNQYLADARPTSAFGRVVTSRLGARTKIEMLAAPIPESRFNNEFVKK